MVTLKTFDGSQVTPEDDSAILKTLLPDGIISGCDFTVSEDNKIHISDGYIVFKGRNIQIVNENFSAKLSPEGTVDGAIYLKMDLNNRVKPIIIENEIAKQEFTDNEMLLATYKATVTGVFELKRVSNITNNQLVDVVNNIVNGANPTIGGKPYGGKLLWEGEWNTGTISIEPGYILFAFNIAGASLLITALNNQFYSLDGWLEGYGRFATVTNGLRGKTNNDNSELTLIKSFSLQHYPGGGHSNNLKTGDIKQIYGIL